MIKMSPHQTPVQSLNGKYSQPKVLQKSYIMVSKTKIGPVEPKIVRGWPEKKPKITPTISPETMDSIDAIRFSVASPVKLQDYIDLRTYVKKG